MEIRAKQEYLRLLLMVTKVHVTSDERCENTGDEEWRQVNRKWLDAFAMGQSYRAILERQFLCSAAAYPMYKPPLTSRVWPVM
ncbi:hypothetical protein SAMN05421819_2610 [Bryocella elongata]|uniref:Uncharacterized protein n=1 Tax=Bryocella elongata TaxID=863522 RepID=A0A1H5ZEJ5_9BACT|nr:hypothetical protein SAMN05421819_2610 [Bryocella elongata]